MLRVLKRNNIISIHAPRERSDLKKAIEKQQSDFISIHAPRERSDEITYFLIYRKVISIHAPRERSDF